VTFASQKAENSMEQSASGSRQQGSKAASHELKFLLSNPELQNNVASVLSTTEQSLLCDTNIHQNQQV